jgi:hypothetical protein
VREHQQQEVEPNRCMCNQSVLQQGFFPGTQTFAGEPQKHIEVASRMFRVLKPEIIEKQNDLLIDTRPMGLQGISKSVRKGSVPRSPRARVVTIDITKGIFALPIPSPS